MTECIVFYEDWQMQCCGTAFNIGDTIEWVVYTSCCVTNNYILEYINADYYYEAHSDKWEKLFVLYGIVSNIQLFYQKHSSAHEFEIKNSKEIDNDIFDDDYNDNIENMTFKGYIVKISDYFIRPAQKQDIHYP